VIISKWLTRALPERWAAFIDEKARVASREGATRRQRGRRRHGQSCRARGRARIFPPAEFRCGSAWRAQQVPV